MGRRGLPQGRQRRGSPVGSRRVRLAAGPASTSAFCGPHSLASALLPVSVVRIAERNRIAPEERLAATLLRDGMRALLCERCAAPTTSAFMQAGSMQAGSTP